MRLSSVGRLLVLALAAGGCAALQLGAVSTRRALAQAAGALASSQLLPAVAEEKKAKRPKFITTDNGAVYFDLKEGGGYSPQRGDFVVVTYKGYLSNGKLFDSSDAPGKGPKAAKYGAEPAQMLKGWEEAMEGMREGGIRVVQIPPALAYGEAGICSEDGSCLVVRADLPP
jgi:FKBP-type peptidyl-prolyl cis-trans isomerase